MAAPSLLLTFLAVVFFPGLEGYTLSKIRVDLSKGRQVYTDSEIAKYDDSDPNLPLYMAVRGIVFDVSAGKSFYGKDASYNALTGKDATRGVAMMSLEPSDLNHDLTGLDDEILEGLDKIYEGVYLKKYPIVGYMKYLVDEVNMENVMVNDEL